MIFLADTVVVTAGGSPPDVATLATPKEWKEIAYFLNVSTTIIWAIASSLLIVLICLPPLFIADHSFLYITCPNRMRMRRNPTEKSSLILQNKGWRT